MLDGRLVWIIFNTIYCLENIKNECMVYIKITNLAINQRKQSVTINKIGFKDPE